MLDWMWQRGWDQEYGGILYFVDVLNHPVQEYWHDMKFWWPQCEALIATLLAYRLTGETRYAAWHQQLHDWVEERFPDRECGEWYGYLHRDGRRSLRGRRDRIDQSLDHVARYADCGSLRREHARI